MDSSASLFPRSSHQKIAVRSCVPECQINVCTVHPLQMTSQTTIPRASGHEWATGAGGGFPCQVPHKCLVFQVFKWLVGYSSKFITSYVQFTVWTRFSLEDSDLQGTSCAGSQRGLQGFQDRIGEAYLQSLWPLGSPVSDWEFRKHCMCSAHCVIWWSVH